MSKILTVMSLKEGVEKEIHLMFKQRVDLDGRTVWYCELEDETITDLATLIKKEIINVR